MLETSERKPIARQPKYEPLPETIDRIFKELESKNGEPELKTGIEALDRGIFGLHKAQLTTIAARAGQGKTSLACNIAFNLANQGHKVAYVSLEMAREQIVTKMFCSEMKVDGFKFLIGKVSEVEKQKLEQFKKVVEDMPLRIIDDYCFTEDELFTLIEHLEFHPEVLIIDHLQHIRAINNSRRSERENLSEYLRYLKEISMRFKIAVVCLSQINREGDDRPTLKTLKGTGSIEEMSDHCVLLHFPKKDEAFTESLELKDGILDIAKNRFGPTGNFEILFNSKIGLFMNKEFYQKELS